MSLLFCCIKVALKGDVEIGIKMSIGLSQQRSRYRKILSRIRVKNKLYPGVNIHIRHNASP